MEDGMPTMTGKAAVAVRWRELATRSTPVHQVCSVPVPGREGEKVQWVSALVKRSGEVIGRSMQFEDARFYAEARAAVIFLASEVETLERYSAYVKDVVELAGRLLNSGVQQGLLPMTLEEWLASQGEPER